MTLGIVSLLAGCADASLSADTDDSSTPACGPGFVMTEAGCEFSEEAVAEVVRTFDQGSLVLVNAEPFMQEMGTNIRRNVWVSPTPLDSGDDESADASTFAGASDNALTAVDLYLLIDPSEYDTDLPEEFPVGTFILHEAVDREEGHGIQVKLSEPKEEDGRDWWFGKMFDDGKVDETECSPCIACHNDDVRPTNEGLWGVPTTAL
jgi:hypothetical protein